MSRKKASPRPSERCGRGDLHPAPPHSSPHSLGWSVNAVVPRSGHLLLSEPCSTFTTGCCTLRAAPFPKANGPWHSVCESPSKGGKRCGKAASHLSLCPFLNEISVPTGPSCVLCRQLLEPCLTAGCNGGIEDGFGRCCWESYWEALFSFSPTGCPDSKPLFRKTASNDRPYASRVRAFSSVALLGCLSEPS
jgi:hypothetical protein